MGWRAGKSGKCGTEPGAMVGQVDQQRAVVACTGAALQHPSVTVQLHGESQARRHPPDRGMPGQQHDRGLRHGQQQRVVQAHMFTLMRQHQLLLSIIPCQQPLRHHDLGLRHADHRRTDVTGDAHRRAVHGADWPLRAAALKAQVDGREHHQQRDAGDQPHGQQRAIGAGGYGRVPCAPALLRGARDRCGDLPPRGAECGEQAGRFRDDVRRRGRGWERQRRRLRALRHAPHRRHRRHDDEHHQRSDPRPAGGPAGGTQRRFGTPCSQRQQRAQQRDLRDRPGDHASSPSRSANNRRMRSSSPRLSLSSETKCANSFSADPWKIDSRTRARALSPAVSAATVAR